LVAGYAFNVSFFVSRYASAREAGYRLYFRAAYYGAVLVLLSTLTYMLVASSEGFVDSYSLYAPVSVDSLLADLQNESIKGRIQLTLGIIISLALLLGVTCGQLLTALAATALAFDNLYTARIPIWSHILRAQAYYLDWVIRNDDFEKLLLRSVMEDLQVSLSMKNGKVYVGYVVRAIDPSEETTHVRLLPMRSGQRDDKGRINFTTDYRRHYVRILESEQDGASVPVGILFPGNYEIVLTAAEIISANIFLDDVYDHIQEHGEYENDRPGSLPGEFAVSYL
jgi:hypothetical protein